MSRKRIEWFNDLPTLRKRLASFNAQGRRYGHKPIKLATLRANLQGIIVSSILEDCYWCGAKLSQKTISFDHYIPLSDKGEHGLDNLVFTDRRCNLYRGSTSSDWWAEFIEHLEMWDELGWFFSQFQPSRFRRGKR